MDWNVDEYELPVPASVVQEMRLRKIALADLAGLPVNEILASLRNRWKFEGMPHLSNLAETILELPLSCLSIYEEQYWLTFNKLGYSVSIAGSSDLQNCDFDGFPVASVPSLSEFLSHFGGMADGELPPGGFFWPPSGCVLVSENHPNLRWGRVKEWTGSLALYHGSSGDQIVIHPEGHLGMWSHDAAWEGKNDDLVPISRLHYSFAELVDEFVHYLLITMDDPMNPRRRFSPFFL